MLLVECNGEEVNLKRGQLLVGLVMLDLENGLHVIADVLVAVTMAVLMD